MISLNRYLLAVSIFTFSISLPTVSVAHWYVEVQASDIEFEIDYTNGTEVYDIDPTILKFGYMGEPVEGYAGGVEIHIIGESEDDTAIPGGTLFRSTIDTSLGLHGKYGYYGERFGFYLTLGLISLDTTNAPVNNNIKDTDDVLLIGGSLGMSFRLVGNLRATVDYSSFTGDAHYPIYITGTGRPDIGYAGAAVGLNYQF